MTRIVVLVVFHENYTASFKNNAPRAGKKKVRFGGVLRHVLLVPASLFFIFFNQTYLTQQICNGIPKEERSCVVT